MFIIPENFGSDVHGDLPPLEMLEAFMDEVCSAFDCTLCDFDYTAGATKLVLVFRDRDVVYKFPYKGYYTTQKEYNEEEDEYYETDVTEFIPFGKDDYCQIEYDFQENDIPPEFKVFFALCKKEEKDGITYYAQKKCVPMTEVVRKRGEDYEVGIKIKRELSDDDLIYPEFSVDWITKAAAAYGEELVKKFLLWADAELSDMHRGNYGYRVEDGMPVIIDWGGYDEYNYLSKSMSV